MIPAPISLTPGDRHDRPCRGRTARFRPGVPMRPAGARSPCLGSGCSRSAGWPSPDASFPQPRSRVDEGMGTANGSKVLPGPGAANCNGLKSSLSRILKEHTIACNFCVPANERGLTLQWDGDAYTLAGSHHASLARTVGWAAHV